MQSTMKANIFTIILFTIFVNANFVFAGTTQIFSPAGLPQSSTQDYSNPVPTGISAPQTFPTPPIPLGGAAMQSFSTSTIPLKGEITTKTAPPSTPSVAGQDNLPVATEKGSVESFFQCSPLPTETKSTKNTKSPIGSVGKLIWHTLDNLGVPMIMSKDSDLDPSLSTHYVQQPENVSNKVNPKAIHQKIPESELEGTDIPEKNDAKSP